MYGAKGGWGQAQQLGAQSWGGAWGQAQAQQMQQQQAWKQQQQMQQQQAWKQQQVVNVPQAAPAIVGGGGGGKGGGNAYWSNDWHAKRKAELDGMSHLPCRNCGITKSKEEFSKHQLITRSQKCKTCCEYAKSNPVTGQKVVGDPHGGKFTCECGFIGTSVKMLADHQSGKNCPIYSLKTAPPGQKRKKDPKGVADPEAKRQATAGRGMGRGERAALREAERKTKSEGEAAALALIVKEVTAQRKMGRWPDLGMLGGKLFREGSEGAKDAIKACGNVHKFLQRNSDQLKIHHVQGAGKIAVCLASDEAKPPHAVAEGALVLAEEDSVKPKPPAGPKHPRQELQELLCQYGYKAGQGVIFEQAPVTVQAGQKSMYITTVRLDDRPEAKVPGDVNVNKKDADKSAAVKMLAWVRAQIAAKPDDWKPKASTKKAGKGKGKGKGGKVAPKPKQTAWKCECGYFNKPWLAFGGKGGKGGKGERRIDSSDGIAYSFRHFIELYGEEHGLAQYAWDNAERPDPRCQNRHCNEPRPIQLQVEKIGGKVGVTYTGQVVDSVKAGGAAEKAGLRPGMRIVVIDNKTVVKHTDELKKALGEAEDKFTVSIRLEGVELPANAAVIKPPVEEEVKVKEEPKALVAVETAKEVEKPKLLLKWATEGAKAEGQWDGDWLACTITAGGPQGAGTIRIKWDSDNTLSDMPPAMLRPPAYKV